MSNSNPSKFIRNNVHNKNNRRTTWDWDWYCAEFSQLDEGDTDNSYDDDLSQYQ